jgi:hypothetical protein
VAATAPATLVTTLVDTGRDDGGRSCLKRLEKVPATAPETLVTTLVDTGRDDGGRSCLKRLAPGKALGVIACS